jgi:hypothetical protein
LDGVTDTVAEEDLGDEELWEAKDLKQQRQVCFFLFFFFLSNVN